VDCKKDERWRNEVCKACGLQAPWNIKSVSIYYLNIVCPRLETNMWETNCYEHHFLNSAI
jgi:hypothetical protein